MAFARIDVGDGDAARRRRCWVWTAPTGSRSSKPRSCRVTALLIGFFVARPLIARMFAPINLVGACRCSPARPTAAQLRAARLARRSTSKPAPDGQPLAIPAPHRSSIDISADRRPGARILHQEGRRSRQRASRRSAGDHPHLAPRTGISTMSTRKIRRQGRYPPAHRGRALRHHHAVPRRGTLGQDLEDDGRGRDQGSLPGHVQLWARSARR